MKGYHGRLLEVELTARKTADLALPEATAKKYIGGATLAAALVYDRMKKGSGPLDPENPLVFFTGPFTGTPLPMVSRYAVAGISPLTGFWGEATSGGRFPFRLKGSGWDGLFVTGKADKPVYLYLKEGKAEIRDAAHLWGKDCCQTQKALKTELGDDSVSVACIGAAGEKGIKYAAIMNDAGRAAGRCGMGALMGSKNLKAVAASGNLRPEASRPDRRGVPRERPRPPRRGPGRPAMTCPHDPAPQQHGLGPVKGGRLLVLVVASVALVAAVAIWRACSGRGGPEAQAPTAAEGTVALGEAARKQAGMSTEKVKRLTRTDRVEAPGILAPDEKRAARLVSLVDGLVIKAYAEVGDRVRPGQVLAEMHSHVVHDASADYRKAVAARRRRETEQTFALQNQERAKRLLEEKAISRHELQRAEADRVAADDDAIIIDVIEENDKRFFFDVTRCRYAEMYQSLGIQELGQILSCSRDFGLIQGFNP